MSKAYWGPEIRVGEPQPALNVGLGRPARQRRRARLHLRQGEEGAADRLHPGADSARSPIPIPIPDVTPLNPPLGLVPPLPPKITFLNDTAQARPLRRRHDGHRLRRPAHRLGVRHGHARRRAVRPRAQVAPAGRRARRGHAFDGLYYVTSVTHEHQARRVQAEFSLARNGLRLDRSRRCRHDRDRSDATLHGTSASTAARCVNNVDPMQIGRIQAIVPDVAGVLAVSWAMPCVPVAGINMASSRCRRSARRLGRVRARRPRLSDLGRRLLGQRRRGAGAGARRAARASPASRCRRTLQNGIDDQRHARARPAAS